MGGVEKTLTLARRDGRAQHSIGQSCADRRGPYRLRARLWRRRHARDAVSGGVVVEIRGGRRRDAPGRSTKRLELDDDVNATLTSWKVPTNGFDKDHPVTLRGLLSMTAGIGVPGFLGYEVATPLPNLTQILYGVPPANSPPVTVIAEPGSAYHYSGGSYEIAEALMVDATQGPLPRPDGRGSC